MTQPYAPALTDPATMPTDAVVLPHLEAAAPLWVTLFEHLRGPGRFSEQWRFYRDGNSWLLKVTPGSRTICWVSVHQGGFRLTSYFPARAEATITNSALREDLQRQFLDADPSARTRAITVVFRDEFDVRAAAELIAARDGFR